MSRGKGTSKTGGRAMGTPNKSTAAIKEKLQHFVDSNIDGVNDDFKGLEPKDRLTILERYLQYTTPKLQSISVEAQIQAEYDALDKLLNNLPEEAIDKIAERIIKLNKSTNKN